MSMDSKSIFGEYFDEAVFDEVNIQNLYDKTTGLKVTVLQHNDCYIQPIFPDEGVNLCNAFMNLDYSETNNRVTNFCSYYDYASKVLPEQPGCFYYTPKNGQLFGSSTYKNNKCYINKPENNSMEDQKIQHKLAIRTVFDTNKGLKNCDSNIFKNIGVSICNDEVLRSNIHDYDAQKDLSQGIFGISCTKQEILLHKYNTEYFNKEYEKILDNKRNPIEEYFGIQKSSNPIEWSNDSLLSIDNDENINIQVNESKTGVWLNLESNKWDKDLCLTPKMCFKFNEKLGFYVSDCVKNRRGDDSMFNSYLEEAEFHCVDIDDEKFMKYLIFSEYFNEVCKDKNKILTSLAEYENNCKDLTSEIVTDYSKCNAQHKIRNEFYKNLFRCSSGPKIRLSFQELLQSNNLIKKFKDVIIFSMKETERTKLVSNEIINPIFKKLVGFNSSITEKLLKEDQTINFGGSQPIINESKMNLFLLQKTVACPYSLKIKQCQNNGFCLSNNEQVDKVPYKIPIQNEVIKDLENINKIFYEKDQSQETHEAPQEGLWLSLSKLNQSQNQFSKNTSTIKLPESSIVKIGKAVFRINKCDINFVFKD